MTQTPQISDEQVEAAAKALYEHDDAWSSAFPWPDLPDLPDGPMSAIGYRVLALAALTAAASIPASRGVGSVPDGFVALSVYESAVKGREDFRAAFKSAKGIRKQDVIEMLKDRFDASGLSYDAYGATVGLSGEFIRSVLNGKRTASRSILKLLGVEVSYVYNLAAPEVKL